MTESKPSNDNVRIGIEIEGVGSVRPKLKKASRTDLLHQYIGRRTELQSILKRTPLLKSGYFDMDSGQGVCITAEEVSVKDGFFLIQHPAELSSAPYPLSIGDLNLLKILIFEVLTGKVKMAGTKKFLDKDIDTAWGRLRPKIGRNLQTTIGVPVEILLSNDRIKRNFIFEMLVPDADIRHYLENICMASILIEGRIISSEHSALKGNTNVFNIRLMVFMYLIRFFSPIVKKIRKCSWEKDAFDVSFKGETSFIACGVSDANNLFTDASGEELEKEIIKLINEHEGINEWIRNGFRDNGGFKIGGIGLPDGSIQVVYESGKAIKNFINRDKLYTVVESRRGESLLNQWMCDFFNDVLKADVVISNITARYTFSV